MKTNIKALISELSVIEKIELLDCLYHELSGHGTDGDTELAHINTREAAVLKALGGSGTVNEITGLRQYGKGSPPPPPPSSQSVEQKIPEEIAPYIKDILAKGKAIQEQRTAEGYQPYTGPQLAEFTPEQQQAFTGISGLVGTGQQYFDPAARLTAAAAMQPTGQEVSQYMSPYMQQVVDIQQREARRAADVAGQQLASQAVTAGGFGGSRQAILEAEAARNLQQQLGDIQARGLAAAYEDAQARLAAQRQRQLAAGAQFAGMAPSALQTALQEQTALQQVGGLKQAQSQAALDIARGQFEAEKTFPEQTLQQYSSLIRGYAMPPSTTAMTQTPAPSYLQQLAGLGLGAYGLSKSGLFREGGKVGDGKGIASIIVKRKKGGKVTNMQQGGRVPRYIVPSDPSKLYEIINTSNNPELIDAAVARIRELESSAGGPNAKEDILTDLRRFGEPTVPSSDLNKLQRQAVRSRAYEPNTLSPKNPASYYMDYLGKPFAKGYNRYLEELGRYKQIVGQETVGKPTQLMEDKEAGLGISKEIVDMPTNILMESLVNVGGLDEQTKSVIISELRRRGETPDVSSPVDPNSRTSVNVDLTRSVPAGGITSLAGEEMARERGLDFATGVGSSSEASGNRIGTSPLISSADAKKRVAEIEANQQNNKAITLDPEKLVAEQAGPSDAQQAVETTLTNQASKANSMNPFNTEGINAFYSEAIDKFNALGEKQKAALASGEKDLESQKWMAVAELGMSILAQPGGQTFLQAIGKGAKDADTFKTLSKLSDKKRQLALDLVNLDEKTLSREYGINKDAAAAVRADATLGLKYKELVIKRASAKTDAEKAAYDIAIRQAEQARKTFESGKAPKLARGQSDPLDSVAEEVLKREGYKTGWLGGIDTSLKEVFKETYRQAFSQTRGNRQAAENAAINAVRKFRPTN